MLDEFFSWILCDIPREILKSFAYTPFKILFLAYLPLKKCSKLKVFAVVLFTPGNPKEFCVYTLYIFFLAFLPLKIMFKVKSVCSCTLCSAGNPEEFCAYTPQNFISYLFTSKKLFEVKSVCTIIIFASLILANTRKFLSYISPIFFIIFPHV